MKTYCVEDVEAHKVEDFAALTTQAKENCFSAMKPSSGQDLIQKLANLGQSQNYLANE